jgi:AraC family transcriptional regulator of adaptative response / DNA-3-methyladenine glycosylase II
LQKAQPNSDTNIINVTLNYQTPFDWPMMLAFFRHRQIPGIEQVTDTYQRTVALKQCRGWLEVKPIVGKNALQLSLQLNDYSEINQIITRVRRMFDLDANMVEIAKHFTTDPIINPLFQQFNGLRLPGCWDIFEFSIRAILGQQISVKAATTLAGRIAAKHGEKLALEPPNLNLAFPTPKALNNADFTEIGVTKTRHQTLTNWVAYFQDNEAEFQSPIDLSSFEKTLCQIKGIGPWTANYIAMRGLSLPDAFPAADLGIIKALNINENKPTIKQIAVMAQAWQPWRAYAAIYLWQSLSTPNNTNN